MVIHIEDIVKQKDLSVDDMRGTLMLLTAADLREQCGHLARPSNNIPFILRGEFKSDWNDIKDYILRSGLLVSRKLWQEGVEIPSTVGIITPNNSPQAEYSFLTGTNQETMTYLAGELMAGSGNNAMHSFRAGEIIIVPAESILRMRVEKGNVLYHCAYEKQK